MRKTFDSLRYTISRKATDEGGYIGGSSAVEIQLPKGSFRKGKDVDVYFRQQGKVESFAPKILNIARSHYERRGMNPNRIVLEKAKSHIKVIDTVAKKDIADIGFRSVHEKTVRVNGIRARDYRQIARDKRAIIRCENKNSPKYKKAYMDIKLINRAEKSGRLF